MSYHYVALFGLAVVALAVKVFQLRNKSTPLKTELGPTFMVLAFTFLTLLWALDSQRLTTTEIEWFLLGLTGVSLVVSIWAMVLHARS